MGICLTHLVTIYTRLQSVKQKTIIVHFRFPGQIAIFFAAYLSSTREVHHQHLSRCFL